MPLPNKIMASQQSSNGGGGGGAPRPLQMGAKGAYIVRLLMVGDSSCGKTSLVLRFDQNVFSTKFVTTIGVDYRDKMVKASLRLYVMNESTVYVVCVGPSRFGEWKICCSRERTRDKSSNTTFVAISLFLEQVNPRSHSPTLIIIIPDYSINFLLLLFQLLSI